MAKIKYTVKENKKVGTHSFYAVPIPTGKLSFQELCEEACEDNTYSIEEMRGCVSKFMRAVQREVVRGWRCNLGDDFLTIYPNLKVSVKDHEDPKTGELVVATANMVTAANAKSRLGCSVSAKFSFQFSQSVSWQKVDASGAVVEEEDITEGNENVDNNGGGTTPSGDNGGSGGGGGNSDEPGGSDH